MSMTCFSTLTGFSFKAPLELKDEILTELSPEYIPDG